ncbi:beta-lactamase family protein [Mycobacterium kansasii]|uniref:Beta-lactamase family protein n=1 Tax=Mycobacterium kansasii TaxID=1768 RepID=A0A1V3X8Q4_MYCKA|nr:beta-lactamase family protein [Mycobacterium kansasii]
MYHALTWGPLMREIVWRATGKEIRDILAAEILDPLGFRWTNFGVAKKDLPLVAPSHATGRPLPPVIAAAFRKAIGGTVHEVIPYTNQPLFLSTIVPSSNTVSTADELSRFMEILRRGGELDGVRIMRPETVRNAVKECRRLRPDVATGLMPLRWGTGYMLARRASGHSGATRRPRSVTSVWSTSPSGPTRSADWLPRCSAAANPEEIPTPAATGRC